MINNIKKQLLPSRASLKHKYAPVEPRPCSRAGQLTHWGSHAGSHKDEHHQNCSPPTEGLQPSNEVKIKR